MLILKVPYGTLYVRWKAAQILWYNMYEKIIKILKKADYTCKKWKKVKNSKKVEKMLDLLIKI